MGLRLVIFTSLAALVASDCGSSCQFAEPALQSFSACSQLPNSACFTYHECFDDKCKDYCAPIRSGGGGGTTAGQQQTTQASQQTTAGGKKSKGKGKGGACFHGEDSVVTNFGPMKLSEVFNRNDIQVLTRNNEDKLEFSTIYSWIHSDPSREQEYIVFTTESGQELPITGAHLIYETDCRGNSQTIFAKKVQVGKCLYVNQNGEFKESKIVDKRNEIKVGIYAPVTENGNIVVNDVLASCFTNFENEIVQRIVYSFVHHANGMIKMILPTTVSELFCTSVDVPKIFLSFLELSKSFLKY